MMIADTNQMKYITHRENDQSEMIAGYIQRITTLKTEGKMIMIIDD